MGVEPICKHVRMLTSPSFTSTSCQLRNREGCYCPLRLRIKTVKIVLENSLRDLLSSFDQAQEPHVIPDLHAKHRTKSEQYREVPSGTIFQLSSRTKMVVSFGVLFEICYIISLIRCSISLHFVKLRYN